MKRLYGRKKEIPRNCESCPFHRYDCKSDGVLYCSCLIDDSVLTDTSWKLLHKKCPIKDIDNVFETIISVVTKIKKERILKPKYSQGDKVKVNTLNDVVSGVITKITYNGLGWVYIIDDLFEAEENKIFL